MRISSVTYEAVEAACFTLLAKGENPSFNSVYAELGNRGSSEVVQRHIDQWRRATGEHFFRKRSAPGLPDDFVAAGDVFLGDLWRLSLNYAEAALQTQRDALSQERAETLARLEVVEQKALTSHAEMEHAQARIAVLKAELAGRDSTISELRAQSVELTKARDTLESRVKALEDAAEVRESRYVTEMELLSRQLNDERERTALLLREDALRAAGEREQILRQIESIRQEKASEVAAIRQLLASAEEREVRHRVRGDEAEMALKEAQTRSRQYETSIAAAQDRIERLQKQLETSTQAASKKESAVAAADAKAKAIEEFRIAETARADRLQAELLALQERLG